MSIPGIHGTATPLLTASPAAADSGPVSAAGRSRTRESAEITATPSGDGAENKPAPLRFPWLSRLSTELAAASKKPVTFAAPVLGDNVDKQA